MLHTAGVRRHSCGNKEKTKHALQRKSPLTQREQLEVKKKGKTTNDTRQNDSPRTTVRPASQGEPDGRMTDGEPDSARRRARQQHRRPFRSRRDAGKNRTDGRQGKRRQRPGAKAEKYTQCTTTHTTHTPQTNTETTDKRCSQLAEVGTRQNRRSNHERSQSNMQTSWCSATSDLIVP